MLQIKKKGHVVSTKFNVQFLFRKRNFLDYKLQKSKNQCITLRSPKNFNIGKYKIYSLNYKTPTLINKKNYKFFFTDTKNFFLLYQILIKLIKITPTTRVNSIRIKIKTSFKLMWLEI